MYSINIFGKQKLTLYLYKFTDTSFVLLFLSTYNILCYTITFKCIRNTRIQTIKLPLVIDKYQPFYL